MNGGSSGNVVGFQRIVIGQLFATKNQFDLIDLNPFLFLQGLFDRQNLIFRFKIKGLFTTRQCFNKNLRDKVGAIRVSETKRRTASGFAKDEGVNACPRGLRERGTRHLANNKANNGLTCKNYTDTRKRLAPVSCSTTVPRMASGRCRRGLVARGRVALSSLQCKTHTYLHCRGLEEDKVA